MTDFKRKRFICIATFPTGDSIGTIRLDGEMSFEMANYANLYRLLNWWEYRCPEEMPVYVEKISDEGYYVKGDFLTVSEWLWNAPSLIATKGKSRWVARIGGHFYNADALTPKTQDEYNKAPKENRPSIQQPSPQ